MSYIKLFISVLLFFVFIPGLIIPIKTNFKLQTIIHSL